MVFAKAHNENTSVKNPVNWVGNAFRICQRSSYVIENWLGNRDRVLICQYRLGKFPLASRQICSERTKKRIQVSAVTSSEFALVVIPRFGLRTAQTAAQIQRFPCSFVNGRRITIKQAINSRPLFG